MNRGGILLGVLLLAGCSSSGGAAKSPPFATHFGQDAAVIASHIPGCSGVAALSSDLLLPGAATAAECRIEGHELIVYGWSSAADQTPVSSVSDPILSHAQGAGWTAVTNDAASPAEQAAIARRVAVALGGRVVAD